MAVITLHKSFDMSTAAAWSGTVTNATSTNITVQNGAGRIAVYNGTNFTYSTTDLTGGTLTNFAEYTNSTLQYTVTGLALSAVTFKDYLLTGDVPGLMEYVASGSDIFFGSTGSDVLAGYAGGDELYGDAGPDVLYGGDGNDDLYGESGNDWLFGDGGNDWAIFRGARGAYTMQTGVDAYLVSDSNVARDGMDSLRQVERAVFTDMSVNLTVGATAATITTAQLDSLIELYIAYINRVPDADGMAFWIGRLQDGQTLSQIGESFYNSAVQFSSLTGYSTTMSNEAFVRVVYSNVLGRDDPDTDGVNFWTGQLATGASSRGTLVASMLGSAHSFKGRSDFGWVADLLDNKIEVGLIFAIEQGLVYNTSEATILNGMDIAAAVTPDSIADALALIGVNDGFSLY